MFVMDVVLESVRNEEIATSLLSRIGAVDLRGESRRIVRFSEISPELQTQFEHLFRDLLNSASICAFFQNRHGNFNVKLKKDGERIFLLLNDKKVELEGNAAQELFQSLMGAKDARLVHSDQETIKDLVWQKTGFQSHEARGWSEATPEIVAVGADLLSIIRNGASAITPDALSISAMGAAGGALTGVSGALLTAKGLYEVSESKKIGDQEGVYLGGFSTLTGITLLGIGVGMVVNKAAVVQGAANLAEITGNALNIVSVVTNLFTLGYASYQLKNSASFRSDLNESIEKQGFRGGIEFLHEKLSLTEADLAELNLIIDPKERKDKMENKLKCKWAQLERRTDSATLQNLLPKIDGIKNAFDEGRVDAETMENAKSILESVLHANYKSMVKSTLLILVSLIGIAAVFASIVMTGGASSILFAMISGMWLVLDKSGGTDFIAEGLWRMHLSLAGSLLPESEEVHDL